MAAVLTSGPSMESTDPEWWRDEFNSVFHTSAGARSGFQLSMWKPIKSLRFTLQFLHSMHIVLSETRFNHGKWWQERVSLSFSYPPFQSHVCVCVCVSRRLMVCCSFPPGLAGSALHLHIRPIAAKITQWNHHHCTRRFRTLVSKSGTSAGSTVWWLLGCVAAAWPVGLVDLCRTGLIANHTSKSLAMQRSPF